MDKTILIELIAKELTRDGIAKELGKSRSVVDKLLAKHGLRTKRHIDTNSETRRCRGCNKEFPIEEFPGSTAPSNGKVYRRWLCHSCYVYSKTSYKQKMASWLEEVKRQCVCAKCGNDDFRVLDFHHKNGDKSFGLAEASRRFGRKKILEEIAKCEPLCANCHRILTYEDRKEKWNQYWCEKFS